jgi:hypothetical protein
MPSAACKCEREINSAVSKYWHTKAPITKRITTIGTNQMNNQYDTVACMTVQNSLKELGYYHGEVDGELGPKTRSAIAAFENNKTKPSSEFGGTNPWLIVLGALIVFMLLALLH